MSTGIMAIEKHYTIKQVAEALQLSQRTIRRWIKQGRLYAVEFPGRYGSEYRIPESAITALGFRVTPDEPDEAEPDETEEED